MKMLLSELGFLVKGLMRLYYDNKVAISIAHNPIQHDWTKHMEVNRHFIKVRFMSGQICIPFVKTDEQ